MSGWTHDYIMRLQDTNRRGFHYFSTGIADTLLEDGASVGLNAIDTNVASIAADNFSIAFRQYVTPAEFCNMRSGPVLVYSEEPDWPEVNAWFFAQGYWP